MSTDPDKDTACPIASENQPTSDVFGIGDTTNEDTEKKKKSRSVCFPHDDKLVTQYFEPANPWQDVPTTTRAQLAAEYLDSCRRHNTTPIESVLQQIRELPETTIGGSSRAPRLSLVECELLGAAPADALEAVLRKVQFRRFEVDHAAIDDEGAEAIFDMIEYYESATVVCISGPRQFGIRGWQAASRMIKKSAELLELEVTESALEASHAPVLARALRPHTCRLRALCLQRAVLCGEPLLCLVIALKSNSSVRELRLPDNHLSVADAFQISSLLRFNTRIQLLDLSNNQIQDAGVGHLADALAEQAAHSPSSAAASPLSPLSPHHLPLGESRGLAFLVLWNNQLTRNCAQHLSKALRSSHSLCVLNIGRNALGTDTVRALQAGGALISLGLQAARLGPEAARALADLIRADTRLQRLDLRDNKLGSAGLQAIIAAMKENTTLTQIDLDDPADDKSLCAEDREAATVARLTREIRAACRCNEPAADSPERRVHRKISLTCHTAALTKLPPAGAAGATGSSGPSSVAGSVCGRAARLRSPAPSPAPSPAGSPVPAPHAVSRFSVTRVTPERESSTESSSPSTPTRPTYCPTPSRFKVVQVAEPPQIQVHPASNVPRRCSSRFSVTRNYDSMYNPTLVPSPPPGPGPGPGHGRERLEGASSPVQTGSQPVSVPTSSSAVISEPIKRPLEETQTVPDVRKSEMTHNSKLVMETEIRPELTDVFVESVTEIPLPVECHVDRINSNKEPFSTSGSVSSVAAADVNTAILAPETKECKTVSMSQSILVPSVVIESKVGATSLHGFKTEVIESPESRLVSGNSTRHVNRCGISEYGSEKTQRPDIMVTRPDDETSENVLRSLALIDNKLTESAKSDNNKDQIYISDAKNDETISQIEGDSEKNITSIIKSNHNSPTGEEILGKNVKTYSDILKTDTKQTYKDNSEQLTHNEEVSVLGDDKVLKTETKLVKNSVELSETDKVDIQVEVTVKKESVQLDMQPAKVHRDQNVCEDSVEFINIDDITVNKKEEKAIKQIEAITEDLGNLIKEMKDLSTKTAVLTKKDVKFRSDCTQTDIIDVNSKLDTFNDVPVKFTRDSVVLKKNKSESSLDSPDLEVSRLMNKKLVGSAFCDSSSSLEISGSSMESLNALDNQHNVTMIVTKPIIIQESVESDTELDRRKSDHVTLSTESSIESNTSEVTPVNSGNFLNMSVSSNESVSPIIFGKNRKIHDSLSSLEASVSSLDSGKQEKVMVTSADSGIEYSLQNPSDNKDDNSSNEGTLTNNSSLKDSAKKPESLQLQETLTSSPKRTSSLLDVPALKSKGLDRMRKISWVAPSSSFHIPRLDSDKTEAKPSHLEKLLSLFQHPSSIFSRSTQSDEERKSASNTPPRKDSSLTSTFWSWGSTIERVEKDDKDDSSEATDSTLSERVQVSFVDESFSKKLDSKTPSTDTDNTLSEFQSFPVQVNSETSDVSNDAEKRIDRVTDITTDDNLVQKCLGLSLKSTDNASSNGNRDMPRASDNIDLRKPNDLNKNVYETPNTPAGDNNKNSEQCTLAEIDKSDVKQEVKLEDVKPVELIRPRSFAAVLKASGSENSLDKQISPESGQLVDKLPSKIIRGIKENISPENTLTSSMTNTKALAFELTERQVKNQPIVNTVWEVTARMLEKNDSKTDDVKIHSDLAPIATIEETCDEAADNNIQLDFIDDIKCTEDENISLDSGVTSLEAIPEEIKKVDTKNVTDVNTTLTKELENIDLGKDALSYLIYENQDFEPDPEHSKGATKVQHGSLAQELKEAEIKEMLDLSPELIIDEAIEVPEVFITKEMKGLKTSPVIPERAKLKKSNSLEDLSQLQDTEDEKTSPKAKTIVFKVPETTSPRDIPERRTKLRTRSGSSPKSLPESLNKPCPLTKIDSILSKKKKKVSSLGKMAKDSLLALNMSEDEIAEFRRSYKLTSVESLRSLESVSEDANSQSGNSIDSRCRACLRTSQESLMSLDSITEDCRCGDLNDKPGHSAR